MICFSNDSLIYYCDLPIVIGRILQAWDGNVTPLTVLWCRVPARRHKNNKTHYKWGICCIQWGHNYWLLWLVLSFTRCIASRRVNITMSAFVIRETTNNKHYSTQHKTRVWIFSGKFFKYENIQAVSQKRQTCKVGIASLYRNSLWA